MQEVYALDTVENRKLRFLYSQSGIDTRYSAIPDYSHQLPEWKFYPHSENLEPFPDLEHRMRWYNRYAAPLSVDAIRQCIAGKINSQEITHLITVSCTGMSAPGLDLMVMDLMILGVFLRSVSSAVPEFRYSSEAVSGCSTPRILMCVGTVHSRAKSCQLVPTIGYWSLEKQVRPEEDCSMCLESKESRKYRVSRL